VLYQVAFKEKTVLIACHCERSDAISDPGLLRR